MNPAETAAQLDDKSIKILRLLLREERHLNPGLHATLTTPMVTKEYGWTNQTVLRRFRKLRNAGLVNFGNVRPELPDHDRYPRPPKAIDRCVGVDELREIFDHWDGRETRSPAQLTDDLADLDHRLDSIDDRHTNRTDAVESKQYGHLRYHATADRERARRRKPALYLVAGAVAVYLLGTILTVLFVPGLLVGVLLAGGGALVGAALATGIIFSSKISFSG